MMTTSINFHFRPSVRAGRHRGRLYIRIIRARQVRHVPTDYRLYADEWDRQTRKVVLPDDPATGHDRIDLLAKIGGAIENDLERLREIVSHLSRNGDYTASDVAVRFCSTFDRSTVGGYAAVTADLLSRNGRERTARAYRSAARRLADFNGGKEVFLSRIDAPMMRAFEQHMIENGLKMNTVSFYLRNIRALYFRAVAERLIVRQHVNPFAGMHTGVYETKRRALDGKQLKDLAALEESLLERLEALADPSREESDGGRGAYPAECRKRSELHDSLLYFLFSYHARGMSFVDMAHLRREEVVGDAIVYKRRKTGGMLEVKITEPMKRIMSHFAERTKGSDFVFPVIDSRRESIRRQYETGLKRQNRTLKALARMAGIEETLSTHAARHTWATLAKRLHVPVAVIGEALGHRDVKTTTIYLASFDRATMDELSVRLSEAAQAA